MAKILNATKSKSRKTKTPGFAVGLTLAMVVASLAGTQPEQAQQILKESGVTGGLVVHVGCGDGKLTAALRASDAFVVQGLDTDPANVAKTRQTIRAAGLYGPVSAETWSGGALPYADNLARLLVAPADEGRLSKDEILRVLSPGGVAVFLFQQSQIANRKLEKPWPQEMDEWTHFLHDASGNATSRDARVAPPRSVQWLEKPLYYRSHSWNPSMMNVVTARGRLFYFYDEGPLGLLDTRFPERWQLIARDAFSGQLLWKKPMPDWGWRQWEDSGPMMNQLGPIVGLWSIPYSTNRRLVAAGDELFVTLGYRTHLSVLDAATGAVKGEFKDVHDVDEVLLKDGVLLLSVREIPRRSQELGSKKAEDFMKEFKETLRPGRVVAMQADTGKVLWEAPAKAMSPETLATANGRVCYYDYHDVVALDFQTGEELWRTPAQPLMWKGFYQRRAGGVLMMTGDLVFFSRLGCLSAKDGNLLWNAPAGGYGFANTMGVNVSDGILWTWGNSGSFRGYDAATGKVVKDFNLQKFFDRGHHVRCYRAKATAKYLITPYRGAEFLPFDGNPEEFMAPDWLRAGCGHGFVPANGLLYGTPDPCGCYSGAKFPGIKALAGRRTKIADSEPKLETGPAYEQSQKSEVRSQKDDWPTYRGNAARSGHVATTITGNLRQAWETALGGELTPPVIADGRVVVARKDADEVIALASDTGKALWQFTTGGPVSLPPTIYEGRVLFGCNDGWVYCLRASDGALAWRFQAAPAERKVMAYGRLESAWPVAGSVLVEHGVAYVSAGRHTALDDGLFLFGLDPATGKVLHRARLKQPVHSLEELKQGPAIKGVAEGSNNDVFVGDGQRLYLIKNVFDSTLQPLPAQAMKKKWKSAGNDAKQTEEFSPTYFDMGAPYLKAGDGFLNESLFNRRAFSYSRYWGDDDITKCGHFIVFDSQRTYAVDLYPRSQGARTSTGGYTWASAGEPCELIASANDAPAERLYRENMRGPGFPAGLLSPALWKAQVPLAVRGLALAGDRLFLAGAPTAFNEKDPLAPYENRTPAEVWAVGAADGKKQSAADLSAPPVFDGIAAAAGRLFVTQTNGQIACLAGEKPNELNRKEP